MEIYLRLFFWWLAFFATHSLLAAGSLKRLIYKRLNGIQSYYRLCYNIISSLLLLPIIYELIVLPNEWLWAFRYYLLLPGITFLVLGIYVLFDGFKAYYTAEFLGFYQLRHHEDFQPADFNRSGWNSIVRHPLYFGILVSCTGLIIGLPLIKLIISAFMVMIYTLVGTIWEEQKLQLEFGESYRKYKKIVPMLIPYKGLRWRNNQN